MSNLSRRDIAALAAGSAIAVLAATSAEARQGNMDHAIDALREARRALHDAPPNKGGHKERALELIDRAIEQVKEGIEWANHHR